MLSCCSLGNAMQAGAALKVFAVHIAELYAASAGSRSDIALSGVDSLTEREAGADARCCAAGQDRWRRPWRGINRTESVPSAKSRCAAYCSSRAEGTTLLCRPRLLVPSKTWPTLLVMPLYDPATAVKDSTCLSLLQALHGTLAKTNSQATARFVELQQMKLELLQRQAALSPHASAYSSLVRSAAVLIILL